MCYGCWEHAGKPSAVTPAIVRAADLVSRLYETEICGGHLHVIVDDWNLEDHDLSYSRDYLAQVTDEDVSLETEIINALEPMSEAERFTVLALQNGFIVE